MRPYTFLLLLFLRPLAWAEGTEHAGGETVQSAFADPPVAFRPFFRYWVPDATATASVIDKDVESIKRAGAGGFELLGFYNYGGTQSSTAFSVTDWTTYGWGTEAWRETTRAAFRASQAHGLKMDFALGPNQGSGVPAEPDAEGLMLDLVPFNVSIPQGGSFRGILPGWGAGTFVAASTAMVLERRSANLSATPGFLGPYYYSGTRQILSSESLQDVSHAVDANGHVDLIFPANDSAVEYRLFAFYEKMSGYREQVSPAKITQIPQSPVTSFIQNGSWVNDHFSVAGARLIIDFWENHLLDDDLRNLLQAVGHYAWEDSMEFGGGVAVWWTPNVLQDFRSINGYDFTKYLPLLFSHASEVPGPLPSPDRFSTNDDDEGQSYLNDYYFTLTTLNRRYLTTLSDWAEAVLQCEYSAQVVYNLPMEMAANIPAVGVPECESLGFVHLVDAYKQFSGPANLAGRNIISNELGAVQLEAYTQTLPELIWDVKRSIIGGVNRMVYHGYPYSGYYPNTTWPGYTTFYYTFSSMHGPRQPAWEYYSDYMNWTARMQYVAQSGIAKIDVAFWVYDVTTYEIFSRYNSSDMDDAGFTYEYISPSNFDLNNAFVQDRVLAPDRQAFKALVIRGNDTMTLRGVQKIEQWASVGLPIVFCGGIPDSVSSHTDEKNLSQIREILGNISKMKSVHLVPEESLAASLSSAVGLKPRAAVEADGRWLTYWREWEDSSRTFVVLYSDAANVEPGNGESRGTVTLAGKGAPYYYDAWTGAITAIHVCQQTHEGVRIPISLAGNQSIIVALHHDEAPSCLFDHLADGVTVQTLAVSSKLPEQDRIDHDVPYDSDGRMVDLAKTGQSIVLGNWTVVIESWLPPNTSIPRDSYESNKFNSSFAIPKLTPWSQISDSLRNTSGRGFYSTSFDWPLPGQNADGARLDLGYILHTASVRINGHQVPPLDPVKPVADISKFLVEGRNKVNIVVTTTLGGAVRSYWANVATSGVPASLTAPSPSEQPYGLVAPVSIIQYNVTRVFAPHNESLRKADHL